jgi:hypothetical protein
MSIQKKSLISTLKTAKKANVAAAVTHEDAKGEKIASMRLASSKSFSARGSVSAKSFASAKVNLKSLRSATLKSAKASSSKAIQ